MQKGDGRKSCQVERTVAAVALISITQTGLLKELHRIQWGGALATRGMCKKRRIKK